MNSVTDYIEGRPEEEQQLWWYLHELLTEEVGLEPKIRHKIPFYYGRSWICYLNAMPANAIEIAFLRGIELSNIQGLPLQAENRKMVRGVIVNSTTEPERETLLEVIQEAVLLDELPKGKAD